MRGPANGAGLELPAPVIVLEALRRFVPPQTIRSVLIRTARQTRRIRRPLATAVVRLIIGIGIWTDRDVPAIRRQVVGTLRSSFLSLDVRPPPCKSVLSEARTRSGACVMRQRFVATSMPIARDRTRGAFCKTMRLMAIEPRRLSFIHAVRVLRETAPLMRAAPTSRLRAL